VTLRKVPRALTEAAVHYIHATYVDHRRAAAALPPTHGRVLTSTTALGSYDAHAISQQACFFRMISVVEAYADTLSSELFRERAPTTHELVRRLMDAAERRGATTWEERRKTFAKYHGFRHAQLARWSELDAGIEVRNAIAHGLGRLTPRQRTASMAGKLGQIGVTLTSGCVVITDASLQRCRDVCVDFIRSLDLAARPASP